MIIDIPIGKGRLISEVQSAKLSSEIGVISRQFIPVPTKWKVLKNEDKFHVLERLNVSNQFYILIYIDIHILIIKLVSFKSNHYFIFQTKFQMKFDDDYVKQSVMSILTKLSRNQRYRLYWHYKSFPNDEVARQNNHSKFHLNQEYLESLCDLFNDPNYRV